ncbi:MAG: GNAT family N-acetyltransferase [Planctomycetota bacterium]|jgi:phosphinothricin acetyltransferase
MHIRDATSDDLPAVFEIYNREIRESTAIFDTSEVDEARAQQWFQDRQNPKHPGIVMCEGDAILGVAWMSAWSYKCGYARAAEVSVYVHRDHHRKGIGRQLLEALKARARENNVYVLLARIEASQEPSKKLHMGVGFTHIGTQHRVGEKFGRILDVDMYECSLE